MSLYQHLAPYVGVFIVAYYLGSRRHWGWKRRVLFVGSVVVASVVSFYLLA